MTGLRQNTTYYLALRSADVTGNFSSRSTASAATPSGPAWTVELLPESAFYQNLAFDSTGEPAVGYVGSNGSTNVIRLARRTSSGWVTETVDTGETGVDLAFHPSTGNPALSYGWGKLKFAEWTGSAWKLTTVEKSNAYNDVTSLAFDSAGNPTIAYRTSGNSANSRALKFAKRVGSTWSVQTVAPGAGARYNSLVYDDQGRPLIAYSDDPDGDNWLDAVRLASWNGTSWQIDEIESGVVGYGVFVSVAWDPVASRPCLVHSRVRFACRDADGTWIKETLAAGNYESLAIDSSGTAYVTYTDDAGRTVLAKRAAAAAGSAWELEVIEEVASQWITSLVLRPGDGKPSVSYAQNPARYARRD